MYIINKFVIFKNFPNTLGRISDKSEKYIFRTTVSGKNKGLENFGLEFELTDLGV
jgi:hypothetical protein